MFLITPLYNVLAAIISFFFSFLPIGLQSRLLYERDSTLSGLYLLIANYLLKPLTLPNPQLRGKTAIVTGANSGIGLQIATDLARQNATVYLACRNLERGEKAVQKIHWRVPTSVGHIHLLQLDTSSIDSVRACAEKWASLPASAASDTADDKTIENKKIDILVHNAGIPGPPPSGEDLTADGLEVVYATNFLGGFLLTYFLEPYLAPDARVVLTSSTGSYFARFSESFATGPVRGLIEDGFHAAADEYWGGKINVRRSSMPIYGNTKGMQVVFARLLQERFDRVARADTGPSVRVTDQKEKVTSTTSTSDKADLIPMGNRKIVHAFTPGLTQTPIFKKLRLPPILDWFGVEKLLAFIASLAVDVEQGAATGSWLCMTHDEDVVGVGNGGRYWDRQMRHYGLADVLDRKKMERLWTRWEKDAGVEWR